MPGPAKTERNAELKARYAANPWSRTNPSGVKISELATEYGISQCRAWDLVKGRKRCSVRVRKPATNSHQVAVCIRGYDWVHTIVEWSRLTGIKRTTLTMIGRRSGLSELVRTIRAGLMGSYVATVGRPPFIKNPALRRDQSSVLVSRDCNEL